MFRKWLLLGLLVAFCALITGGTAIGADGASGPLEQAKRLFEEKRYAEAEAVYLEIAGGDAPEALTAQRQLTLLYIASDNLSKADVAYQELLSRFAGQEGVSQGVWGIAREYGGAGEKAKALAINKYNVERFPHDKYAMWSQVEIAYSHIRDGDETAANEAVVKLLNTFSEQEGLPKEIHQMGRAYDKGERNDEALELYRYNVECFPQDKYAMWSQVESVYCRIEDANETAAEEAVEKLVEVFSEQATLPKELYQVAMRYKGLRAFSAPMRALALHEYNVEHYPDYDDVHAMWSQTEITKFHIRDGNEAAAEQAYEKLLTIFSGKTTLPKEVCIVGDVYCQQGNCDRASQTYRYVLDKWPGDEQLVWARAGMIKVDIALGKENGIKADIDSLVDDFKDNPALAEAVGSIAEALWTRAAVVRIHGSPGEYRAATLRALAEWDRIIEDFADAESQMGAAYYFSGECYEALGEPRKALERYEALVRDWPDFQYAWSAHVLIVSCLERLIKAKEVTVEDGAERICEACRVVLSNYSESMGARAARTMLRRWERAIEGGRK